MEVMHFIFIIKRFVQVFYSSKVGLAFCAYSLLFFISQQVYASPSDQMSQVGYNSEQQRAIGDKQSMPRNRSLYVWSKSFNGFDNTKLLEFLKTKSINNVMVSYGKTINQEKLSDFLKKAINYNLHTEMMVGDNKWVFPENHGRAAQTAAKVAAKYQSIHLDIEPQAFPDFKEKEQEYIDNYIAMLQGIRNGMGTHRLTVALPLHWPISSYGQISNMVDGIYLMAYSNDEATLKRRLQPIIVTIPLNKTTVILRARDFSNGLALEQMIEKLNKSLGTTNYGIENFETFFMLSQQK